MRVLTKDDVIAAVKGGSVFASGGGGWVDHGLEIGEAAVTIGQPKLVSVDELPDDAIIVTCTAIGAPAGDQWQMLGSDYIKAVKLLMDHYDGKVVGVMTPQNGMSSTINGSVARCRPRSGGGGRDGRHPGSSDRKNGIVGPVRPPGF